MKIVEYMVIGVQNPQSKQALCAELNALQATGQIRLVDLIFVTKPTDGDVMMQEADALNEQEAAVYNGLEDDLRRLLTGQDVEQPTEQVFPIPAIMILFEYIWVIGLSKAIRKGGGLVFNAGLHPQGVGVGQY